MTEINAFVIQDAFVQITHADINGGAPADWSKFVNKMTITPKRNVDAFGTFGSKAKQHVKKTAENSAEIGLNPERDMALYLDLLKLLASDDHPDFLVRYKSGPATPDNLEFQFKGVVSEAQFQGEWDNRATISQSLPIHGQLTITDGTTPIPI